ncbi:MAG: hypothetical protein RL180_1600 [Pseudomonadota bacterium]|jgi:hypothetical protein
MTAIASQLNFGKSAWCKIRQGAGAVLMLATLNSAAWSDDSLPPPSNLEDAKSDILQLDRDLALLDSRLLLTNRTTLLFGLSAKSQLSIRSLTLTLDNQPFNTQTFDDAQVDSLRKGGMATIRDFNLPTGQHVLNVMIEDVAGKRLEQRFNFKKTNPRNIMALEWSERPAPNTPPIKLIEWIRND